MTSVFIVALREGDSSAETQCHVASTLAKAEAWVLGECGDWDEPCAWWAISEQIIDEPSSTVSQRYLAFYDTKTGKLLEEQPVRASVPAAEIIERVHSYQLAFGRNPSLSISAVHTCAGCGSYGAVLHIDLSGDEYGSLPLCADCLHTLANGLKP